MAAVPGRANPHGPCPQGDGHENPLMLQPLSGHLGQEGWVLPGVGADPRGPGVIPWTPTPPERAINPLVVASKLADCFTYMSVVIIWLRGTSIGPGASTTEETGGMASMTLKGPCLKCLCQFAPPYTHKHALTGRILD